MAELPYTTLPAPPDEVRTGTVLARLVDAIGFRYRWATEGLDEEMLGFRPVDGSYDLRGLLLHVVDLVTWVRGGLGPPPEPAARPRTLARMRRVTLETLVELREALLAADDASLAAFEIVHPTRGAFPLWHAINGPLADALTHIGQISSWRRIAGRPTPAAHVFLGTPPRG